MDRDEKRGRNGGGKMSNPAQLAREPSTDVARVGRKPTCSPETTQRIIVHIASGCSFTAACARVGVSRSTAKEWRAKGRQGLEPYLDFEQAVQLAEDAWAGDAEQRVSGADDWKAQAWMLERRRPEYRPPNKVELTGKDGGPILVDGRPAESMTDAELAANAVRLAKELEE